jgi:hypothetical protein
MFSNLDYSMPKVRKIIWRSGDALTNQNLFTHLRDYLQFQISLPARRSEAGYQPL